MPPLEDSLGICCSKRWASTPGRAPVSVSWHTCKIQDLLATEKTLNYVNIDALDNDEEVKHHMYPPHDMIMPQVLMKMDVYELSFKVAAGLIESFGKK